MNRTKPVYRICLIKREKILKSDLFRVTLKDNVPTFDKEQNMAGRGAYIKKDKEVIEIARKRHAFIKALKCNNEGNIYDELLIALSEEKR